jgi:TetR/AcrR family transcriptional regulator
MTQKRKRLTAAERKPQILRSAIRAMARSNYRTTSIAEIAAEAGITEPAVYRYFPTKKALFIAILEDVGSRVLILWETIIDQSPDPVSAMRNIAVDYYDRAMTRRGDLKVLFQALAEVDDEDIRTALHAQFDSYVKLLKRLLEECMEAKMIQSNINAEAAAWSWLSVGFTLNLVSLLGFDEEVNKNCLMQIQRLFLASLAADEPTMELLLNNMNRPCE